MGKMVVIKFPNGTEERIVFGPGTRTAVMYKGEMRPLSKLPIAIKRANPLYFHPKTGKLKSKVLQEAMIREGSAGQAETIRELVAQNEACKQRCGQQPTSTGLGGVLLDLLTPRIPDVPGILASLAQSSDQPPVYYPGDVPYVSSSPTAATRPVSPVYVSPPPVYYPGSVPYDPLSTSAEQQEIETFRKNAWADQLRFRYPAYLPLREALNDPLQNKFALYAAGAEFTANELTEPDNFERVYKLQQRYARDVPPGASELEIFLRGYGTPELIERARRQKKIENELLGLGLGPEERRAFSAYLAGAGKLDIRDPTELQLWLRRYQTNPEYNTIANDEISSFIEGITAEKPYQEPTRASPRSPRSPPRTSIRRRTSLANIPEAPPLSPLRTSLMNIPPAPPLTPLRAASLRRTSLPRQTVALRRTSIRPKPTATRPRMPGEGGTGLPPAPLSDAFRALMNKRRVNLGESRSSVSSSEFDE